ncbi:hypothetical protein [Thalassobacillus sp. CUG 92003]|uniref:hypothetical protein n=1 Tax=Thalassobacillus sp. CUG 92003 TaxID=2736641 RepID=UPI0015E64828|nr:hypothetical protein [Thalassobacillus sp. CUG 92003]
MNNVIFIFILVFLSFAGYGFFIRCTYKVQTALIPILLFSTTAVLLFIGGLLNILPHIAFVIFAGGLAAFVYSLWKWGRRVDTWVSFCTPATLFFLAGSIFFAFFFKDSFLMHYDNFTHWGLIVKEMVGANALPDDSTIVSFRNYPPGTALFIYYMVTLVGFSETMAIIAQAILITGTLTTLFVFATWKRPSTVIASFAVVLALLWMNGDTIHSLMVDSVLGYIAVAALLVGYATRHNLMMMMAVTTPVLSLLVLTKDSGKLFFAIVIIALIFMVIKRNAPVSFKHAAVSAAGLIGLPLLVNFLWGRYTQQAYEASYESNRFAVTGDTFGAPDRPDAFIKTLTRDLLSAAFDVSSHMVQTMLITVAIAVVASVFMLWVNKRRAKGIIIALISVLAFYLIYIVMLYILYLYLMPQNEAAYLAGMPRYQSSAAIFFVGALMFYVIKEWDNILNKQERAFRYIIVTSLAGILLIFPLTGQAQDFFDTSHYKKEVRSTVADLYTELRRESNVEEEDRLTVIQDLGESDRHYLKHLIEYERLAENQAVYTYCETNKTQSRIAEDLNKSAYLMVIGETSSMESCLPGSLETQHLEQGIYKLDEGQISSQINSD